MSAGHFETYRKFSSVEFSQIFSEILSLRTEVEQQKQLLEDVQRRVKTLSDVLLGPSYLSRPGSLDFLENKPMGVGGGRVKMGDQLIHSDCFKCHTCSSKLAGQPYFNVDNHNVCKECYTKNVAPSCAECNEKIVGSSTSIGEGKSFHPTCFKCDKCGRLLKGSFTRNSRGKFEHPDCSKPDDDVKCKDCSKALVNVKYFTIGSDRVCQSCYEKNHSKDCHVCKEKILEGESHTVNDWSYHKECFKCPKSGCGKYLGGRKLTTDQSNNVVCSDCKA